MDDPRVAGGADVELEISPTTGEVNGVSGGGDATPPGAGGNGGDSESAPDSVGGGGAQSSEPESGGGASAEALLEGIAVAEEATACTAIGVLHVGEDTKVIVLCEAGIYEVTVSSEGDIAGTQEADLGPIEGCEPASDTAPTG